MKVFRKILSYTLLALLLLVGAAWLLGKYYNKEVKNFIVAQLNERLIAPVNVGNVELTLIENFPQASLRFSKVVIADRFSPGQKDTLLFADRFYLSFNFWDIWNKDYRINEMKVQDGMFFLKFDEKGESNLSFWKETSSSTPSAKFEIDLKKISIQNIHFRLSEPQNKQSLSSFVKTAELKGNFKSGDFRMNTALNCRIYQYSINGIEYVKNKDVNIATALQVSPEIVRFSNAELSINQLQLKVNGHVAYGDSPAIDLSIGGNQVQVSDLLASLPEFAAQRLKEYKAQGTLQLNTSLKGPLGNGLLPIFNAAFSMSNGSLAEPQSGISLSSLYLSGKYSSSFQGNTDSLWLAQARGRFNTGDFDISGSLYNFLQPEVHAKVNGNLDLEQVFKFFRWQMAEELKGMLKVNIAVDGIIPSKDSLSLNQISKIASVGQLSLRNGKLKLKGNNNTLDEVNGSLTLSNNEAQIDKLSFKTAKSDFVLKGSLRNLVPYLLQANQGLSVSANLSCKLLDLSDFIADKNTSVDTASPFRLVLPPYLVFDLSTQINKLVYQKFEAKNMQGRVAMSAKGILFKGLQFDAFDGKVAGQLALIPVENGFVLDNSSTVSDVSLEKVFYQFNSFDQDFITDKNLKGIADATVLLQAKLNPDLSFVSESINCSAKLKINKGQLNKLKALQDMTSYFKSNVAIKTLLNVDKLAERLKSIQFANLENTILIKDGKITLPEMSIVSSALDINVYGIHGFDGKIDYNFNFRLPEVFRKNEETEDGYLVDDNTGLRLFINMSGTTAAPKFRYDKAAAALARKEKFKEEKTTFKSLMKEGFGLFKGDSTVKEIPQSTKAKVRFELEDDKPVKDVPKDKPKPKAVPKKTSEKKEYDNKEYNLDDDL